MKVVTLVPWRGGDELREQSWSVVRPYLERLGFPIYEGDSVGAWSRAGAINAASSAAGDWDVAIIADADTIPPPRLGAAIAAASERGAGIRPHDHLFRLTPSGSLAVAAKGVEGLESRHILDEYPGGGLMVVARKAWDAVGGFDERFVGWGHEDSAFGIQLIVHADWDRVEGVAYHLWHPDSPKRTREYTRNAQMIRQARVDHGRELKEESRRRGYALEGVL